MDPSGERARQLAEELVQLGRIPPRIGRVEVRLQRAKHLRQLPHRRILERVDSICITMNVKLLTL